MKQIDLYKILNDVKYKKLNIDEAQKQILCLFNVIKPFCSFQLKDSKFCNCYHNCTLCEKQPKSNVL